MVGNIFLFILSKETRQTAGPVQGHGERSPEGGAVWKENAEEKEESLKTNNIEYFPHWTLNALCAMACSCICQKFDLHLGCVCVCVSICVFLMCLQR